MTYNKTGVSVRNGIIYVQGSIDGTFYRKSTKKKATKENLLWAEKNAESVLLQFIGKKDVEKSYTLKEFGYQSLEINAASRKENTNHEYKAMFEKHILPRYGNWKLNQIKPTTLKAWQNDLYKTLSGKRIMTIRTVFRGILQDAFIDELIDTNPFDKVKPLKVEKTDISPFSLEEIRQVVEASKGWFQNYLVVAFFTGMRIGEILALQWDDIDFLHDAITVQRSIRKGVISTPKTASSIREIDMLPTVKDALMKQSLHSKDRSEFVFINQYGRHFTGSTTFVKCHWHPLLKGLDIKYRILYQTRHTFASIMLQQGEEIGWVSQMMGHTDIHTTLSKYARFIPNKKKRRAVFLNNIDFGVGKSAQNLHNIKGLTLKDGSFGVLSGGADETRKLTPQNLECLFFGKAP